MTPGDDAVGVRGDAIGVNGDDGVSTALTVIPSFSLSNV